MTFSFTYNRKEYKHNTKKDCWATLVAQRLKRLPGMRETRVRFLGWEDPLETEMATHSSTLAWRIPWREEPGRRHKLLNHSKETNVRREQRRATQTTRKE